MYLNSNNHSDGLCSSWIFYGSEKGDVIKIQKEVDHIFSDYSFYPEIEWGKYGYRAPEGHQVLGAWRHPQTRAFAFLLDNPSMVTIKPSTQTLLYITGDETEISKLRQKCDLLKSRFADIRKKDETISGIATRLDRIQKSKPLGVIMTVLALFTAFVNGFSLYLRKLPAPNMRSEELSIIYGYFVVSVHIGSLALLLIIICFLAIFLFKYGRLVLKRF